MSARNPRSLTLSALSIPAAAAVLSAIMGLAATPADAHSRHHRHYHGNRVVEAPFTRVETSNYRHRHSRTSVWAPFTRVHVSGAGTYVRAPFVDLFVPR